jgi:hypothetical protein
MYKYMALLPGNGLISWHWEFNLIFLRNPSQVFSILVGFACVVLRLLVMVVFSRIASAVAILSAIAQAQTYLSPAQDILLPASGSAENPLEWLGANGPNFAGELVLPFVL